MTEHRFLKYQNSKMFSSIANNFFKLFAIVDYLMRFKSRRNVLIGIESENSFIFAIDYFF